ncbi:MAG: anaerobic ribonucleoside-triphosphate reductase activating protein, partial [Erysipelotrichaceae bacterium]|nr:anaerobic ribonucleoside-triphosphate reductase activating protein [Erysipelotrichaceae bacterium]
DLYALHNEYVSQLMKDFGEEKAEEKIDDFGKITRNAHETVPEENYNELKFGGIQKLTLLDYPGQVACTLFTVGCNMKCPFCHNRDLVFVPENFNYLDPDDVLAFLEKRRGIIDAVCITGGEPLLQAGLLDFLKEVKELGYQIKVDTNGLYPEKLKEIVESGYVDYIAMDVKNSFGKYCETIGLPESEQIVQTVKKSMKYLLSDPVEYEFRTTVVRELHTKEDLKEIAKAIRNCKNYYLQQFVDSGKCIKPGYHSYDAAEMREMAEEVQKIIPNVQLRGV